MSESEFRYRLEATEKDIDELRQESKEFRRQTYERLNRLESAMQHMPTKEEMDLMKSASDYYRARKEFTDKMLTKLAEKGLIAVAAFILGAAAIQISTYIKGS